MFVPISTPEAPQDCELRALRLSLNSPVVALEPLPVGPAAAAIALHVAAGRARVTIVVRAERSGERIFYASDESPSLPHDGELLLDAGLSFAESMGFLFDDDEVETRGGAGSREATRIWLDFAGLARPAEAGAAPPPEEPAREPAPLALTKFRQRIEQAEAPRARSRARVELLGRF